MNETDFYRAMTARYRELAGCQPDEASDIALRFHALAGELAGFSARLEAAAQNGDPAFAAGEALDSLAAQKGLTRKPAACASGKLTFTRREAAGGGAAVPEGTQCAAADGAVYLTTEPGVFAEGAESVTVAARAALAGREGDALPGSVTLLRRPAAGVAAVANPVPFAGGRDAESDEALRARLLAVWASPANGVNGESYRSAAENWPGIDSAAVFAGGEAGSVVVCIAADGSESVPEGTRAALEEALNGMREPCAAVTVQNAAAVAADLRVEVEPARPEALADTLAQAEAAVRNALGRLRIGEGMTKARLCQLMMNGAPIRNCQILLPAGDLAVGPGQVLRAGTLTVSRMGG